MKQIIFWYQNARPVSLPQSMMPALVAAFMAARYPDFRWYLALLCLIGIAFAHLSMNLFDDYFDYTNAEQGDRSALVREGFRAMTVKCLPLQDGTVSPRKWLLVSCLFGAIACCFGLPVLLIRGLPILWTVLGVGVIGLFYSAPPLKLGYHGLGELTIGCIFGPGIFIGMNLGASGEVHLSEVLISIAVGLLVVAILYVHSIMDYAADTKARKRTLAWLVGCHKTIPPVRQDSGNQTIKTTQKGSEIRNLQTGSQKRTDSTDTPTEGEIEAGIRRQYLALSVILFLPYVMVLFAVLTGVLKPYYAIAMLALPWSGDLFRSMLAFRKDPFSPAIHKKWYGAFAHWDQIREAGIDWFMLRWLLAQRVSMIFSFLCILACIIELIVRMASI